VRCGNDLSPRKLSAQHTVEATQLRLNPCVRVVSDEVHYPVIYVEPSQMACSVNRMKPGVHERQRVADVMKPGRRYQQITLL
jgi:hypothetical protein